MISQKIKWHKHHQIRIPTEFTKKWGDTWTSWTSNGENGITCVGMCREGRTSDNFVNTPTHMYIQVYKFVHVYIYIYIILICTYRYAKIASYNHINVCISPQTGCTIIYNYIKLINIIEMSNGRVLMLLQKRGSPPPYFQFLSMSWSLTLFTYPTLAFLKTFSTLLIFIYFAFHVWPCPPIRFLVWKQKQKALLSEGCCTCAQIESCCSYSYT